MVASMQPVALPPINAGGPAANDAAGVAERGGDDGGGDGDEPPAGALLKRAFEFFKNDKNSEAADAFRAAIATGNLNDAGRALAYWHIFVAEQSDGHTDRAAEALAGFEVIAQDVLDIREQLKYAEDDNGDFVDRFDVKRRLARARAILSANWAGRVVWFGRSAQSPVPIHNSTEMNYFLELAPPCARAADRHIENVPPSVLSDVAQVQLFCNAGLGKASYFFQVIAE